MRVASRLKVLSMLLLVAVLAAACASGGGSGSGGSGSGGSGSPSASTGSSPSASPQQSAPPKPVELRWGVVANSPEAQEIWKSFAQKVTETYPHITLKLEAEPFNQYWTKLQAQIASRTAPDIIQIQSLRTATFAPRGAFEPLQNYFDTIPGFEVEDFDSSILEALSWNGDQIALPFDFGPLVLFYNKDLFDKYNVPYPDENMTWEGFLERAKALTRDGNYGALVNPLFDHVIAWIWSNGGEFMDDEMTTAMINQPAAVEAVQFLSDLIHVHKVAPKITDPGNSNWGMEQFQTGKIGMYTDGPWRFVVHRANADFNWDVTILPQGKNGSVTWVAGSGFGIYSQSRYKEDAWKALTIILGHDAQKVIASTGRGFPARKSAVPAFSQSGDPRPEHIDNVHKAAEMARKRVTTTNWTELDTLVNRELDHIWVNNAPVQEVLDRINPMLQQKLDEHQSNMKNMQ